MPATAAGWQDKHDTNNRPCQLLPTIKMGTTTFDRDLATRSQTAWIRKMIQYPHRVRKRRIP